MTRGGDFDIRTRARSASAPTGSSGSRFVLARLLAGVVACC